MNRAYVVTADLSLAACVLTQTTCLWLCPYGHQMGVCADDLGGAMSFGFYLEQTDRTGVAAAAYWTTSVQMNRAYVVTVELSQAACVLTQTACL